MNKQEKIDKIMQIFLEQKILKIANILDVFHHEINRVTIYRYLQELIKAGKIRKTSKGKYEYITIPKDYFEIPFFERAEKSYNFDFLKNYIPNKTCFLSEEHKKQLFKASDQIGIETDYYKKNKRKFENLLIDISFASSKLEGNTYSYLDTEVLINFNEVSENKLQEETQMVLNHKETLEYMIYYKNVLGLEAKTFFETHILLGKNLLYKEDLGKIRQKKVEIGRSKYTPLENQTQLKEQFDIFLEKLNAIQNPFEQSLFILVFIPYFQLFLDINKRVSRLMCNLPLLQNNLGILSLLQVKEKEYITAILAIYELNDISMIRDIFIKNYILNIKRYI